MKKYIDLVLVLGSLTMLSACMGTGEQSGNAFKNPFTQNQVEGEAAAKIDARVDVTRSYLFDQHPGSQELEAKAAGVLYMPLITEAGFGIGGAYGRGSLRIGGITEAYYSTAKATYGLQIGAQQYAHALFFMTPEALSYFQSSEGWAVGANLRYAVPEMGLTLGKDTTEIDPVVAYVFGQSGLIVGATLSGMKYNKINP
jgi:lipid-binding SYLF domain-containing protein